VPELTSKQTIALVVAAVASIGLAVLAFAPERFSMGLLPVMLLYIILLAVSVFALLRREGKEQRVLWLLVLVAVAWWPLLLLTYFSESRPAHIVILSAGGILLGALFGIPQYLFWKNRLKDGIIVEDDNPNVLVAQVTLLIAVLVALYFLDILSSGHREMLSWLLICAISAYFLYLTLAVLLLEWRIGQKMRFAHPQKISWGRLVVMIASFITFALVVFIGISGHR
jgi:hypothetical protein